MEEKLINYYNKFNEDKRLNTRHGIVEFNTTMEYIKKYLDKMNNPKIIDIGAGTGKYSITLADMGYDVTAVELVKHNLQVIKQKTNKVKVFQGNAIDLKVFKDNTYDLVLLFGPLYHLMNKSDQISALKEAKRITKDKGIIMVVYCMNDFAIIRHGFMDQNITDSIKSNIIDNNFKIIPNNNDLYNRMRLEDIDSLNEIVELKRIEIISQDGLTDYIRPYINKLTEKEFKIYLDYHLKTCKRKDMLGYSAHLLDILEK